MTNSSNGGKEWEEIGAIAQEAIMVCDQVLRAVERKQAFLDGRYYQLQLNP